jgi:hypothetical protein
MFLVAATALALVVLVLLRWQPSLMSLLSPCPFLAMTGAPCPTCGTTRCALALSTGHPGVAFAANPLAAASLLLLGPAAVASTVWRRFEFSARTWRLLARAGAAMLFLNWTYLLLRY